jgi:hypothetical protein
VSLSPPVDGDYYVIFECEMIPLNNAAVGGIAIGVNSITAPNASSVRINQGQANQPQTVVSTNVFTGLTTSDLIYGVFRKVAGPNAVALARRRVTMIRVA